MISFSILIILLCIEWFYFNWSHGIYALLVAVGLKFAIAINFTRKINRINRDYPKEEENSNWDTTEFRPMTIEDIVNLIEVYK